MTDLDDPWGMPDYRNRCALARSILGHTDGTNWREQLARALAALDGASIEQAITTPTANPERSDNGCMIYRGGA